MCANSQVADGIQRLPFTQTQVYTGELIEGDDVVEFRLLYVARVLGASRTNTRAVLKHDIRREFHPQLRRLWLTNPNLREMAKRIGYEQMMDELSTQGKKILDGFTYKPGIIHDPGASQIEKEILALTERYRSDDDPSFHRHGMEFLLKDWLRNGYTFLPLVTERFCVRCSLDILIFAARRTGITHQQWRYRRESEDHFRCAPNAQESCRGWWYRTTNR